jgi:hypothetical protein
MGYVDPGSTRKQNMPTVYELFDLARQCYAESNRTVDSDAKEHLREKGDLYMQEGDQLRRAQIIQAVFPSDKISG